MSNYACSILAATWYPGALGVTSGSPFAMLAVGDLVDGGSLFAGGVRQLVQTAQYVRADQPDHWTRGNRTGSLEFTKHVRAPEARAGLVSGMAHALSLPTQTGWILLEIDGETTDYALDKVAFEELGYRLRHRPDMLELSYRFRAGALSVYSGDPPAETYLEGELLLEGDPTDRVALLLE